MASTLPTHTLLSSADLGVISSSTSSYTLGTGTGYTYTMPLDNAYLESHDHLGNVRAVMDGAGNIVSYSNYYAFGGLEPTRCYSSNSYRYGFNGKEKDDNILGDGTFTEFKFREYDNRLGRFFSIDPLANTFPYWTPYQFAGNTPVWARELEGKEVIFGLAEFLDVGGKLAVVSEDGVEIKPTGGSAEIPKPVIDPIPGQVEPNVGPPAPDAGNPGADFGSGSEKLGKNVDKFIEESEQGVDVARQQSDYYKGKGLFPATFILVTTQKDFEHVYFYDGRGTYLKVPLSVFLKPLQKLK